MLRIFLFISTIFFSISCLISQDLHSLEKEDLSNYSTNIQNQFIIQLNNIGDPILLVHPSFDDLDFSLSHYSKENRLRYYMSNNNLEETDSIYSQITYKSMYNSGGLLKTFLTRPVGEFIKLSFSYHHFNSEGFYLNQENKNSYLSLDLNYFDSNKPYSYSISFLSNNINSNNNGGTIYDSRLGSDLMNIYLTNSQTFIKHRLFNFKQYYIVSPNLKFHYSILYNLFTRDYFDSNPISFHYSLTPLYYSIDSEYNLNTFYSRLLNSFSISNKNFQLDFNYNYYTADNVILPGGNAIKDIVDFDVSFTNTSNFREQKDVDFQLCFSPYGYNKKNYIFDLSIYKKYPFFFHTINLFFSSKKPNFFTRHYDTSYNFNWDDFLSIRRVSARLISNLIKYNIFFSSSINHYRNFLYFNELASPQQSVEDIIYFNFLFTKKWILNNFYFKSNLLFQYSDNSVLSVPNIFFTQLLQYNFNISKEISLLCSLDFNIFSKYYVHSFFPLTDVFYNQTEEKRGFIPFVKADVSMYKDNFSIGCVFNNLTTSLFEGQSFISNYPFAPPTVQLFLRWSFID